MDDNEKKKQRIITLICIGIAVILIGLACWFIGIPLLKMAREPEEFRAWIEGLGFWGPIAYIGLVVSQILIAFMPGEPFELVAGYAFGALQGTVLCFIGEALGSIIVLLLVRKYGIKLLEIFFQKEKIESLKILQTSEKRTMLFTILFLVPGTPKDLLCYFAGLTDIPMPLLMFICIVCRFPSIITSTAGGSAINEGKYLQALIIFLVTLAVSIGGVLLYNKFTKKRNSEKSQNND